MKTLFLVLTLCSLLHAKPVPESGLVPDETLTPGAWDPKCSVKQVCTPGWAKQHRNVSDATKRQVFQRYHLDWSTHARYEVDHRDPLCLCGLNDIKNLWPQPRDRHPGADEKDRVEDFLYHQVCKGKMSLGEAQAKIHHQWVDVYEAMRSGNI